MVVEWQAQNLLSFGLLGFSNQARLEQILEAQQSPEVTIFLGNLPPHSLNCLHILLQFAQPLQGDWHIKQTQVRICIPCIMHIQPVHMCYSMQTQNKNPDKLPNGTFLPTDCSKSSREVPLNGLTRCRFPTPRHQHPTSTLGLLWPQHSDYEMPSLPGVQTVWLHPTPIVWAFHPRHTVQMWELLVPRLSLFDNTECIYGADECDPETWVELLRSIVDLRQDLLNQSFQQQPKAMLENISKIDHFTIGITQGLQWL